eukprot:3300960-Karenia_brevis.AAC.1
MREVNVKDWQASKESGMDVMVPSGIIIFLLRTQQDLWQSLYGAVLRILSIPNSRRSNLTKFYMYL